MEKEKISIIEAFGFAFRALIDNFRLFFSILLLYGLVAISLGWVGAFKPNIVFNQSYPLTNFSYLIIFFIVMLLVYAVFLSIDLGVMKLCLNLYDTGSSSINPVFSYFYLAPKYLVAWLLYGIIANSGPVLADIAERMVLNFPHIYAWTVPWVWLILLSLPCIYFGSRFYFFPYFILENASIIGSFRKSLNLTKGRVWNVLVFYLIIKIFYAITNILYLGMLILPFIVLVNTYFYRKLSE